MSRPPSSQTTPQSFRVSDRDLTEIELHSVDSINDLHRTHLDHSHKGVRPPRPAYSPSSNGNPFPGDPSSVHQRSRPVFSSCQTGLQDLLTSSSSPVHFLSAAVITLLLIAVILTCYFLVQQGDAVRMLTEAVKQKEAAAAELKVLIQDLQILRHNLTAMRGGT